MITFKMRMPMGDEVTFKYADGSQKVLNNFTLREFMQRDGKVDFVRMDSVILTAIQQIRNHFGKPVIITSAYRSKKYNKSIGGVSNSAHILGKAIDFKVIGVSIKEVRQYIKHNFGWLGIKGLGIYRTFTHIDCKNRNKNTLGLWHGRGL